MAVQAVPTKGNLMNTKKSLALAKNGYELLDRKRNILIREMMTLIDHANAIQEKIDNAYEEAYIALQTANVTNGFCDDLSNTIPEEDSLKLDSRSVMGVEIPILTIDEKKPQTYLHYGLRLTNSGIDKTYEKFTEVKYLTAELAEIENSVYRLAVSIKKTQKRANALKNIMIPKFEETVKFISDALDEKEREEFSRLKVIKRTKLKKAQAEKEKTTVYYVTDEQQQSQYINMFKQEGLDAVLLTHNIDSPFVTQLEQRNENVQFQRIDADLTDTFKEEVAKEEEEAFKADTETLTDVFRKALENDKLEVKVEKLKNENVASMVTLSEQSRRMQEMMKMYNMYGMDPSMFGTDVTLVLNANHPLVQYVLKNKDGEHVPMFCKQLFDLAMLSNKPLNPEEMTAFINRSNEIMMLLAK